MTIENAAFPPRLSPGKKAAAGSSRPHAGAFRRGPTARMQVLGIPEQCTGYDAGTDRVSGDFPAPAMVGEPAPAAPAVQSRLTSINGIIPMHLLIPTQLHVPLGSAGGFRRTQSVKALAVPRRRPTGVRREHFRLRGELRRVRLVCSRSPCVNVCNCTFAACLALPSANSFNKRTHHPFLPTLEVRARAQ